MSHRRPSRGLLIVPMLVWVAACSDTPNDPLDAAEEAQLNLDVATYAADETIDDLALMTHETDHVFGGPLLSPPGGGDRGGFGFDGPMSPPDGHGMRGFGFDGSLSVTRTVEFFDIDDEPMQGFHREDTERIHFYFLLEGERTRTFELGSVSMDVRRERDMNVRNLAGLEDERIWYGTGSSSREHAAHHDDRGDRSRVFSSNSIIKDVYIPVPRAPDSWPTDGTIERFVHVEYETPNASGERDRDVKITFDGSRCVPIVVNEVEYTFDLAIRRIVPEDDCED